MFSQQSKCYLIIMWMQFFYLTCTMYLTVYTNVTDNKPKPNHHHNKIMTIMSLGLIVVVVVVVVVVVLVVVFLYDRRNSYFRWLHQIYWSHNIHTCRGLVGKVSLLRSVWAQERICTLIFKGITAKIKTEIHIK